MTKQEKLYIDAMNIIRIEYKAALNNKAIYKPLSYALHKAWRVTNANEPNRTMEELERRRKAADERMDRMKKVEL